MKLKPTVKGMKHLEKKAEPKEKSKKENKLPSDTYKPMFPPKRYLAREVHSYKDPTKVIKQYLEFSVKRFDEDIENAPMVYIQMYQESEFYTGYLKGKTVYFPLEALYDIVDMLNDLSEECDKRHIE